MTRVLVFLLGLLALWAVLTGPVHAARPDPASGGYLTQTSPAPDTPPPNTLAALGKSHSAPDIASDCCIAPNGGDLRVSADDIPRVRSQGHDQFANWFDNLDGDRFAAYWADPKSKAIIQRNLRDPGGFHEWAMVSKADKFQGWGFGARDIWSFRTSTRNLTWTDPTTNLPGQHGGHGSGRFHFELGQLIDNSRNLEEFQSGLVTLGHRWNIPNIPTLIRQ